MRKPLLALKNDDLALHPIWLYDGESDATATVVPVDTFAEPNRRAYIARTKFTLRDGTVVLGYCSPTDDSSIDYIQPVIIGPSGHIPFWRDLPDSPPSHAEIAALLAKPVEDVFPCTYESLVPFEGTYLIRVIHAAEQKA